MREVVLDTETTGLDPRSGHRIVEIGCVELINHMATGKHFHKYLTPERDIPEQASVIHGLTEEFLSSQPVFADIAEEFEAFIGDSTLVIHNAEFDLGFINAEREKISQPPIAPTGPSIRYPWHGASSPAPKPTWTPFAGALRSTIRTARCTAPSRTPGFWPRFIWN